MNPKLGTTAATLMLSALLTPALASAYVPDIDNAPPVTQYSLAGPRIGMTLPEFGGPISQFGWHFERQAASRPQDPRFIVENVILVGGVEQNQFIPNANLIFGVRLPSGFEAGMGPSVTLGGMRGGSAAVVFAAGRSLLLGGVRVPINFAVSTNRYGQRFTIITGWAIPQPEKTVTTAAPSSDTWH